MKNRKIYCLMTVFLGIMMVNLLSVKAESENSFDDALKNTAEYVYENTASPSPGTIGGEWAVMGIMASGIDADKSYFETFYNNTCRLLEEKQGILHERKYTEYSKTVTALTSIGKNPCNVNGYNIVSPLADFDKTVWQGINGAAWALIALDNYALFENDKMSYNEYRERYVNYILSKQLEDGGFGLTDGVTDCDVTAMVLTALSSHSEDEAVKTSIDKAVTALSSIQRESGCFVSDNEENCESTAQVFIAMCSLGIDVNDSRFVKNGNTVLDGLMSFYTSEGGFVHHVGDEEINQMSTEQALCALAGYKRFKEGKSGVFFMHDYFTENEAVYGLESKSEYIKIKPIIYDEKSFYDVSENRMEIEELAKRGIIDGKEEGVFDPDAGMTRAEFAAITVKALGLDINGTKKFNDVNESDWYCGYIRTAYEHGIINGISDTEFNPSGKITREEAIAMLARASVLCGLEEVTDSDEVRNTLAVFFDYTTISDWAGASCAMCVKYGIISDEDEEILPKKQAVRAEIALMIYNMLNSAKLI